MSVLDIKKLCIDIDDRMLVNHLSFSIRKGEILGLVGESGSGKSLTALSLIQLLPDKARLSGSISLSGQELIGKRDRFMRTVRGAQIGMIFQEPMSALNPLLRIGQQVQEVFRLHLRLSESEMNRRLLFLFESVGLSPARDFILRYPHELSGGQRQRVAIAIALALNPELVIADEPTTALDVTTQARILQTLKRLVAKEKTSLLLISHDLNVIARMADRIAVMRNGRILEIKDTPTLFSKPDQNYTRSLIQAHFQSKFIRPVPYTPPISSSSDAKLLEVQNLSRSYREEKTSFSLFRQKRRIIAVDKVSFHIMPGESVGLVGESGCGKSTLTRMILGLDKPDSGSVLFNGHNITSFNMRQKTDFHRQVQIVFQDSASSFNPRLKSGYSIAEPLRLLKDRISKADRNARILQSFIEVGLHAEDAEKYPHEFSGGQRQRLSIARALILRPSLIVLDEPVSALDSTIQMQIIELLARLKERYKLSYLFVSHDLNIVRTITDRVLVMRKGSIIESGQPDTVLTTPQMSYTRELVKASPDMETILTKRFPDTEWNFLSSPSKFL